MTTMASQIVFGLLILMAQPAPQADVLVAGRDVPPPVRIKSMPPQYPEWLRQASVQGRPANVQGVVVLGVTVDEEGRPVTVNVLRGIPMFDPAAIEAVKKWRYEPTVVDGVRRRVKFTEYIDFYPSDRERVQQLGELVRNADRGAEPRLWAIGRLMQLGRNHRKEVMEVLSAAAKDEDHAVANAAQAALAQLATTGK